LKVADERREKKRRRELEKRIRHMPPRLREIGMQVLRDGGWYRNGHLDPPEARMPEIPRTQYGRVQPKMNPEVRNYNNLVEAAGDFDFRYPNFDA
jgi:hypothetical protein